jgi:hypothetical protein
VCNDKSSPPEGGVKGDTIVPVEEFFRRLAEKKKEIEAASHAAASSALHFDSAGEALSGLLRYTENLTQAHEASYKLFVLQLTFINENFSHMPKAEQDAYERLFPPLCNAYLDALGRLSLKNYQ